MATAPTTPSPRTSPREGGASATRREIAAFAALVRSTSNSHEAECDADNRSLVSLEDETSGLLLGEESAIDPRIGDSHDEEEGNNCCDVEEDASSLVEDGSLDDDFPQADRSIPGFLLARIKANPSLAVATIFMGVLTVSIWTNERFRFITGRRDHNQSDDMHQSHKGKKKDRGPKSYPAFPAKALLGITVKHPATTAVTNLITDPPYDPTDFRYEKLGRNRTLLYWDEVVEAIEQSQEVLDDDDGDSLAPSNDSMTDLWTNMSYWGPCYPRSLEETRRGTLKARREKVKYTRNWTYIVQSNSEKVTDEDSIVYPTYKKAYHPKATLEESLEGVCRPGFLIIGQGKCGTSSLYHYLTGHPRILPAKEKQIHYFRYHKSQPLLWYYSHFPTIESFLGRGALMTGEASPGYMPYPEVVEAVAKKLTPNWKPSGKGVVVENSAEAWKQHVRALPKIIAIVRDPIDRAVSSYKYNYIEPALKVLKAGRGMDASGKVIPGKRTEKYYRNHHLFTFEELAYAELAALRECLAPGGRGEVYSQAHYGRKPNMFFYESIQKRSSKSSTSDNTDAPPLIHLDGACYKMTKNENVPRAQWKELAKEHPNKILRLPNLQLTQSLIGRGVYALPLDWWYEVFSNAAANKEAHINVVCTEDMANTPDKAMDDVTNFLGLPEFDFTNVTNVGRYNVGGHRGYDTIVTEATDGADEEDADDRSALQPQAGSPDANDIDLVAISDALMNELLHFYHPYNERLFKLIGKRCPWQ